MFYKATDCKCLVPCCPAHHISHVLLCSVDLFEQIKCMYVCMYVHAEPGRVCSEHLVEDDFVKKSRFKNDGSF